MEGLPVQWCCSLVLGSLMLALLGVILWRYIILSEIRDKLIAAGILKSRTRHSQLFDRLRADILILGLTGAGRSTLQLTYLSQSGPGNDISCTTEVPGMLRTESLHPPSNVKISGLTLEKLVLPSATFTVVDYARQVSHGGWTWWWLNDFDAVIWVLDASDRSRRVQLGIFADRLKGSKRLSLNAPVLILGNKIDVEHHMRTPDVVKLLGLHDFVNLWRCQLCSMKDDFGVYEGLQWLATVLQREPINTKHPLVQKEVNTAMWQAFG